MAAAAAVEAAAAGGAAAWRILPRPLLETVLHNHALHHRVRQPPFLLHGPRGVGKTSLILRLLPDWNTGPNIAAYVDFAAPSSSVTLADCRARIELALESLVHHAIRIGAIGSGDIYKTLTKSHGVETALSRVAGSSAEPILTAWSKALQAVSSGQGDRATEGTVYSRQDEEYMEEAVAALQVAKEVIAMHQGWRMEAIRFTNRTRAFSRTLADACTDWPILLLEILSNAAEVDFFQPKLVLNNIDVLRKASPGVESLVLPAVYHDNLILRMIKLGADEQCLPVFLVTSDSYYSYQAYNDFGSLDAFISRENFGWSLKEAKLHMVSEFFSETEWKVVEEMVGSNCRHLSELYMLKQSVNSSGFLPEMDESFQNTVELYLASLQVAIVNPAMDSAIVILQKFASEVRDGKMQKSRLVFGAPWRHPPRTATAAANLQWAKTQLMDFIQSCVNVDWEVKYLADNSLEIFDDPAMLAMVEVGLFYIQRDPAILRPTTRAIGRCLVRWFTEEKSRLSFRDSVSYYWHRVIRGRYYRHLLREEINT